MPKRKPARLTEKAIASWSRTAKPATAHGVPARPIAKGDTYRTLGGRLLWVARVCGRGRNRQALVAVFENGKREVGWSPVATARHVFQEDEAQPFDDAFCRVCGCVEEDCHACIERTGQPCSWVELDLCSACQELLDQERHVGGEARRAGKKRTDNPHAYHDDVPNDMRNAWDTGWCDNHNAAALKSLGAFTSAARRVFGGANG